MTDFRVLKECYLPEGGERLVAGDVVSDAALSRADLKYVLQGGFVEALGENDLNETDNPATEDPKRRK